MSVTGKLAFDTSARHFDADGRLHISRSHITKAAVNPYYGREIPGYEVLGLDPDRVYRLLRHPDELAKAAHTFARLPILSKHILVTADAPQQDLVIGSIGSNVEFSDPYLDADLCYWDASAIAGIETNTVREHSCAYRYVAVMMPGEYQGQPYDGIMTEIRGNHLALVESGRAGSDVLAADEDSITMKMTKLGKALFLTLGAVSPKLAQDSALPGLFATATKKTTNATELVPKLVAMDSELDAKKLQKTLAAVIALDAEKEEKPKGAEDEDEDEDDEDDEEAEDEDDEDEDKKEKEKEKKRVDTAMDSLRRELREADEARRLVRPVVGEVIAQDSAVAIYGLALDHMGVKHDGVTNVAGRKALFELAAAQQSKPATAPAIAQDSAGLETMFPGALRFGQ